MGIRRLLVSVALFSTLLARPAGAIDGATFTVTNVNNSGAGSLRQAMLDSDLNNNQPAVDHVVFSIPGNGPFTIAPTSAFACIREPLLIDGYTQGDATPGTPADDARPNDETGPSTNAVLKIVIDASGVGNSAFCIDAPDTTIRGLDIENASSAGIVFFQDRVRIERNFIGTDATGTTAHGNATGVLATFNLSDIVIGGTTPADRNLISGNIGAAIDLSQGAIDHLLIAGNLIGTKADGSSSLPNGEGIDVKVPSNAHDLIGGTTDAAANVIVNNVANGIRVRGSGSGLSILRNSISVNGSLGIDLDPLGVSDNDHKDGDAGVNHLQNFPVLTSANLDVVTNVLTITGTLDTRSDRKYLLQFFLTSAEVPSGHGEGKVFLGQKSVLTNDTGKASFTAKFADPVPGLQFVSSTATDKRTGDTSEFSADVNIP